MIPPRVNITQSPDFQTTSVSAGDAPPDQPVLEVDGVTAVPAQQMRVGQIAGLHGSHLFLLLRLGDYGLSVMLTPQGARSIAATMRTIADRIEAEAATAADAAIARAQEAAAGRTEDGA